MTWEQWMNMLCGILWWASTLTLIKLGLKLWLQNRERLDAVLFFGLACVGAVSAVMFTLGINSPWMTLLALSYVVPFSIYLVFSIFREQRKFKKLGEEWLTKLTPITGQCSYCLVTDQLSAGLEWVDKELLPYVVCGACKVKVQWTPDGPKDNSHDNG